MSALEFMRNSFYLLIGVLCWGGIILVMAVSVAVLIHLTADDKKEDKKDGETTDKAN